MTSRDPLWDPTEEGDDDLQALETALQPIGVRARAVPVRWRKGRRVRVWPFAAAATVACLAVLGSIQYRLSWVSGDPWQTSHAGPLDNRSRSWAISRWMCASQGSAVCRFPRAPSST